MGSIVVYKIGGGADARYLGMQHMGRLLKENLSRLSDYKKAVIETLENGTRDMDTGNEDYEIKYEVDDSGSKVDYIVRPGSSGDKKFDLFDNTGTVVAELQLKLDMDKRTDTGGTKFTMTINIPEKGDDQQSWEYFNSILQDFKIFVPDPDPNDDVDPNLDNRNYLTGALIFSRCR